MIVCASGWGEMAARGDSYTRIVGWLKITLPLAALGLLSTVFMLSNGREATQNIPFSDLDFDDNGGLAERVVSPNFAGATRDGDLISFRAQTARPVGEGAAQLELDLFEGEIAFADGRTLAVSAPHALVDQDRETVRFADQVSLKTGQGYVVTAQDLIASYADLFAETGGEVRGTGPNGHFVAGKMRLTTPDEAGDAYLVFTDGVKLIYHPRSE